MTVRPPPPQSPPGLGPMLPEPAQAAAALLLVRPAAFGPNPGTLASNRFQRRDVAPPPDLALRARAEFDLLAGVLDRAGIRLAIFEDLPGGASPDAVFPNNWVSFHGDGTAILYPLLAVNRRRERRLALLEQLADQHGFLIRRRIDLTALEQRGSFLEGTGSLVLDRRAGLAFAALSPRTSAAALKEFSRQTGYRVIAFRTADHTGLPVYHTNVMMSIGSSCALVCTDAIPDPAERSAVVAALLDSAHELVLLTLAQVAEFAGNGLEVAAADGARWVMSSRAAAALTRAQRDRLERHAGLLVAPVPLIETFGGGSVRCMLAEIHLPRAARAD